MSEIKIIVSCGEKSITSTYSEQLVKDLKGIMALDLHEELMNMILNDTKISVMKVLVDNKDSPL